MTHKILTALLMTIVLTVSEAYSAQPYEEGGYVVVEATGRGITKTAAKIDARRNAASQALGFFLEGIYRGSSTINDSQVERTYTEKIIRISRAFTGAGEEVLSESENARHIFTVTLRLKVRGSELLDSYLALISQERQNKSSLDGLSMVASAMSREEFISEAGEALAEVFGSLPVGDYVRVSAQRVGEFDLKSQALRLKVNMTFDRERYFVEAVPQLAAVLDYVSEARMVDVPFMLPSMRLNDGSVYITPPEAVRTLKDYQKLMETESGNSVRANVYIQTRDYYFNAYMVNPQSFGKLIESIFTSDTRGNFTTKQGYGELRLSYEGEHGQELNFPPVVLHNMNNILFFTGRALRGKYPAELFILPAFSFGTPDGKGYTLYQEDSGELPPIKVSPRELIRLGDGTIRCAVTLKAR